VSLRPCEPLALIPVNGQKRNRGGNFRIEKLMQHAPLGSPGANPRERKLPFSSLFKPLSKCLRDSAVYCRHYYFIFLTPKKTPKPKWLFMGFPGTFTRSKSRLR